MDLRLIYKYVVIAIVTILSINAQGFSQNSLIDQTFATNGKLMPRYDKASAEFSDALLDKKDRLIVINERQFLNGDPYIEILRYSAAGQMDNTFGVDGNVKINIDTEDDLFEYVSDFAFTSDHRICFAHELGDGTVSIIKLNENGSFDNTFGNNGRLIINAGLPINFENIALTSDNKFVVLEDSRLPNSDIENIIVSRYNSNGTVDGTFGIGGKRLINNQVQDIAFRNLQALTVHTNGKITIFGESDDAELLAFQLMANGTVNEQFGMDGQLVFDLTSGLEDQFYFYFFIVDRNGKFLLSGADDNTTSIIIRFNENGTIDNAFGTNGVIKNEYFNGTRINYAATPSATSGIWLGGTVKTQSRYQFSLGKLNENGSINGGFGNLGYLSYSISPQDAFGFLAYEQSDGKVLLLGFSNDAAGYSILGGVRVQSTGAVDNGYGVAGQIAISQVQQNNNDEPFASTTELHDMKVMEDDGIYHTGTFAGGGLFGSESGIYIAKQLPNGGADPSFGNNGFVSVSPMFGVEEGGKMAVGSNKILTVSPVFDFFSGITLLLTQHTATGQLDASFGDNGRKLLAPTPNTEDDFELKSVDYLPNGKIALLIRSYDNEEDEYRSFIIQLQANGNVDNSFSGDGRYDLPFLATHLQVTNDNRIVVLGVQETVSFTERLAIMRLTIAGIPDPAFNSGNPVIVGYSPINDVPVGMIVESNNELTIGFDPQNSDKKYGIVKLNANGTPVAGWGTNGVLVGDLAQDGYWQHFTRKANGEYLLVGANEFFDSEIVNVLKLSTTGSVDASYGTDGVGLITYTDADAMNLKAVGTQQDGKLLIGGNEFILFSNNNFVVSDFASITRISTGAATGSIIYTMTQPGNWSNPANWQSNELPPNTITSNMEVIINPGGNGIATLDIPVTVQQGGKITVSPGKTFRAMANLTVPALEIK